MNKFLVALACCMSLIGAGSAAKEVQAAQPPLTSKELSFSRFDRRARSGEKLNVVFFGGSLTWGANASDPQLTSYRALIGKRLAALYPRSRFTFWDAAIGGTGSQLGAFRLQRDVLRRNPDLVFLDFTVNDDPYEIKPNALSSYESIIRRLLMASTPVLSIRLTTWGDFQSDAKPRVLDPEHQRIAEYYNVPVADVVSAMKAQAHLNPGLPDIWWPGQYDKTHPYDEGYAAYANVIWASYLQAVKQKVQPVIPEKTLDLLHNCV